MPLERHVKSAPFFFVPIVGYGTPSIAEVQFTALDTDPADGAWVQVQLVNDEHTLWQLGLQAFFGQVNFGLGQALPDYFLAERDGNFQAAPFDNPPGDYLLWYRLTIGVARIVDIAPEAYTVYEFAA